MRLKTLTLLLLITTAGFGAGVKVQFDPRSPEIGPFPTDFLTTPDSAQRTGRRVNLPAPDCQALPSDCGEVSLINQLDGFNPNARLTVKFSGPIDTSTLRKGVFYVCGRLTDRASIDDLLRTSSRLVTPAGTSRGSTSPMAR